MAEHGGPSGEDPGKEGRGSHPAWLVLAKPSPAQGAAARGAGRRRRGREGRGQGGEGGAGLRPLGGEFASGQQGWPPTHTASARSLSVWVGRCRGRQRRRWPRPGWAGSGGDGSCGPGAAPSWHRAGARRSPEEAAAAARSPTHGPADLSSEPPSAPSTSLGPECPDPLRQALADEELDSQARGSPEGARTLDSEPLLGATAAAAPCARPTGENEDEEEQGGRQGEECPICTEPYGPGEHRRAQLNCGHGLCSGCLHRLLDMAPRADLGRVRCPLCRQKTPMLEWEICRLQEELLLADGPQRPPPPTPPAPARRGPGPWASLERHYQLRFLAGPVGGRGCLPFLPCPPCLGTRLWALRERGPCARRLGLLGLLGLELLGLLLTFTPLVLLGLLFVLLDRSGH